MPPYPPHWAPPHARCRPFGARFQYGCFSAPQSCARVFVGHLFALGARFRRRASRRITPPAAVSGSRPPAILAPSGVARWSNTSVRSSWGRGVARLYVHARRGVLAQPPFSWPPNGRALVAATWHGHPRPCACGVAHALDKGSGRPLASGMGRSARHTAVLGLPAPPSGPHFRLTNTRRCRAISGPVWHVATPCCSRHTWATRRGAGGGLGCI